jgi:UDP-3-O-[3-hydroxymyristoyl] glucosamine N-acyltransferase
VSRRIRIGELAAQLGRELEGDPDLEITGVAGLEDAGPGDLSFARSRRFAGLLSASRAEAVILPPGLDAGGRCAIRSPRPGLDFARAVRRLVPAAHPRPGVHPTAIVADAARVDASAAVGPGCVVGARAVVGPRCELHAHVVIGAGAVIGADCTLHAGCVLAEGTVLGAGLILKPGVVLGADGLG